MTGDAPATGTQPAHGDFDCCDRPAPPVEPGDFDCCKHPAVTFAPEYAGMTCKSSCGALWGMTEDWEAGEEPIGRIPVHHRPSVEPSTTADDYDLSNGLGPRGEAFLRSWVHLVDQGKEAQRLSEVALHVNRALDERTELQKAYISQGNELAALRALFTRIRADRVEPGLLRWCEWPACLNHYNAVVGPSTGNTEGTWLYLRRTHGVLCPDHVALGHLPDWAWEPGNDFIAASCSCGESTEVRPASSGSAHDWWRQHCAALDGAE